MTTNNDANNGLTGRKGTVALWTVVRAASLTAAVLSAAMAMAYAPPTTTNISQPSPVAPTATSLKEKPFTQILRASYAGQHEVVSSSEFNKTLFAEKLTRPQLIVHLQQRALIHNEVHRILSEAAPSQPVPYGNAQKNVLILLFNDLIHLGSGWPTEPQARPLTASFLQTIRESEKRGPYFALGVQHVYYGGITNGGRIIGQMIRDQIKFTPTYYLQSDGYTEYLPLVNRITDSEARKEMIRGGQAAYQYIIASSNEDVFKAKKP